MPRSSTTSTNGPDCTAMEPRKASHQTPPPPPPIPLPPSSSLQLYSAPAAQYCSRSSLPAGEFGSFGEDPPPSPSSWRHSSFGISPFTFCVGVGQCLLRLGERPTLGIAGAYAHPDAVNPLYWRRWRWVRTSGDRLCGRTGTGSLGRGGTCPILLGEDGDQVSAPQGSYFSRGLLPALPLILVCFRLECRGVTYVVMPRAAPPRP